MDWRSVGYLQLSLAVGFGHRVCYIDLCDGVGVL